MIRVIGKIYVCHLTVNTPLSVHVNNPPLVSQHQTVEFGYNNLILGLGVLLVPPPDVRRLGIEIQSLALNTAVEATGRVV